MKKQIYLKVIKITFFLFLITFWFTPFLNAGVINILTRDFGTGHTLNFNLTNSRFDENATAMLDSNNFGQGGIVDDSISLSSATEITSASLANQDILLAISENTPLLSYNSSEQTALVDFVNNGGTIIGFGNRVGINYNFLTGTGTTTRPSSSALVNSNITHPVLNGPFGNLSNVQFVSEGTNSSIDDTTIIGDSFIEYSDGATFAATYEIGQGRLILFGDGHVFEDIATSSQELLFNTIAYAAVNSSTIAVPEPNSFIMLFSAMSLLGYLKRKRGAMVLKT